MDKNFNHIEGIHACLEALDNDVPIFEILIGNYVNLKQNNSIEKIINIANSQNIKYKKVDKSILDKMSLRGAHQGIISKIKSFDYTSLDTIIDKSKDCQSSLIVILDHIEDSGNLGAIARSAEAFGANGLIIANKRATQVTANTYKTSAGAICHLPIAKVSNINSAIEQLKNNEYWVASASEHSDLNIWDANLKGKIALVMGSEHDGVSQLVLKNSDFVVKLPLNGKIESLNVAQAASACIYEWVRQNA